MSLTVFILVAVLIMVIGIGYHALFKVKWDEEEFGAWVIVACLWPIALILLVSICLAGVIIGMFYYIYEDILGK